MENFCPGTGMHKFMFGKQFHDNEDETRGATLQILDCFQRILWSGIEGHELRSQEVKQ